MADKFLNKTEYENALARIKSYIDGVTPTKLSELTDDIVTGHYLPLSGGTMANTNLVTNLNADKLDGFEAAQLMPARGYTLTTGWLIKTTLVTSTSTQHIYFRIEGKSYGSSKTSYFTFGSMQLAQNGGAISNARAINVGQSFGNITVFLYDGNYYLWFSLGDSYTSLFVTVYGGGTAYNRVESITNSTMPDAADITTSLTIVPETIPNMVTTNTDQTISGTKTFSSGLLAISTASTGTPTLLLQRGTASDTYTDWKIVNDGGALSIQQCAGSTDTEVLRAGGGVLIIADATNGTPTLTLRRGTTSDGYVDHKIQSSGGALGFVRSVSGTDTLQMELRSAALYPVGTVTSNISDMTLGNSTHYWSEVYAQKYYVGTTSAYIGSTAASNIYLANSSGLVFVVDGKVVRRNTASSMADATLGNATYPWGGVYSTEMTIIGGTSGSPTLNLVRGTESDTYADWKVSNDNGTFRIIRSASGTDTNYVCVSSLALFPSGTLTSGVSDIDLGGSSNRWGALYTSAINASGLSTLAGGIVLGTSTNAVAAKMEWDETNNAWKLNGNFYATGFVSAGGVSTSGGSGSGSGVNVIRAWSEYVATDTSQVLGANLGYSLKSYLDGHDQDIYELDHRVTALEQGGGGGGGTTTDPTLRMYPTTTNAWYPVLTRYNTTSGSTYYTEYGRYAADVTINPSNGSLSATNISAINSIDTQGTLDIGLDATIGGDLTVTGGINCDGLTSSDGGTFQGNLIIAGNILVDGVIQAMDGSSTAQYQYPRYMLCASEAAYNAITTKQSDVLYLIPE